MLPTADQIANGTSPPGPAAPARGKPRPAVFRALGRREAPARIEVQGETFDQVELLKHDSWAATALYANSGRRIICKFNRQQAIFGLPMAWLGYWLAAREADRLRLLADVPLVPDGCGPVTVGGVEQRHAVAHDYIAGRPLRPSEDQPAEFFDSLRKLLGVMHQRGLAYVDLHKAENVIVGDDGKPYLIDFQISFRLPGGWLGRLPLVRPLFRVLAESDLYHLAKHEQGRRRWAPPDGTGQNRLPRPWWITAHRCVAAPLREARRRLLVALGIRRGLGRSNTEFAPEAAVRMQQQSAQ
ncbi:MAG: hypothetical protein J5I93_02770 [Pirellulaceae bacterium]|nr:hypothetical protein [Pirellulaceae bacterium]